VKIARIELFQIQTPRYYGHVSGHVLVRLEVDHGPVGWGEASDSRAADLGAIARRYRELLLGRDATCINEINELLRGQRFGSTVSDAHLASAIDLALYDLNGKAQGVPAHQLLGGKVREGIYSCYPIFGWQVQEDFERSAGYLQRLVDLGHHLFRYYVSGDAALDDRFLKEVKARFGEKIRLKSLDFSGRFRDWAEALRYAQALRHHDPFHFEQPANDLRICAQFTRRVDLPVTLHIGSLAQGYEAAERGACTAFNVACVSGGPTHVRRLFALAEAAGLKCLIGTDQESDLGTAAQVHLGLAMPNLDLPCDPMGPVLYTASAASRTVRVEASHIYPPEGPGLGVEIAEEKLRALTVATA
jgi:muconate cycloisomerase